MSIRSLLCRPCLHRQVGPRAIHTTNLQLQILYDQNRKGSIPLQWQGPQSTKATWRDIDQIRPAIESPKWVDGTLTALKKGFTKPLMHEYLQSEFPEKYRGLKKSARKDQLMMAIVECWKGHTKPGFEVSIKVPKSQVSAASIDAFVKFYVCPMIKSNVEVSSTFAENALVDLTFSGGVKDDVDACLTMVLSRLALNPRNVTFVYGRDDSFEIAKSVLTGSELGPVIDTHDQDEQVNIHSWDWFMRGHIVNPVTFLESFFGKAFDAAQDHLKRLKPERLEVSTSLGVLKSLVAESHAVTIAKEFSAAIASIPIVFNSGTCSSLRLLLQDLPSSQSSTASNGYYELSYYSTSGRTVTLQAIPATSERLVDIHVQETYSLSPVRFLGPSTSSSFSISALFSRKISSRTLPPDFLDSIHFSAGPSTVPALVYPSSLTIFDTTFLLSGARHIYKRTISPPRQTLTSEGSTIELNVLHVSDLVTNAQFQDVQIVECSDTLVNVAEDDKDVLKETLAEVCWEAVVKGALNLVDRVSRGEKQSKT